MRCRFVPRVGSTAKAFEGRVGILIPAFNEADHLPALLEACRAVGPAVILVVDDCSTDGTPQVLAGETARAAAGPPLLVVRNPGNLGKQGSVRRGLRVLGRHDLDAVALIDGDGQHDPRELPGLASLLDRDDVVIGARSHAQMPRRRRFSNWLVNGGFRLVAGVDLVDVQSGLRIYRKETADVLADRLPITGGYAIEYESLVLLARHARDRDEDLRVAAATASCGYGEDTSSMRPRHVARLARESFRQAARLRKAIRGPATPAGKREDSRALTVEIHDVTPASMAEVETIRDALARIGVDRVTLLVVPRYADDDGRRWDLRSDPRAVEWLRRQQAEGSEIVQHGLTHRAPGPPPPGVRNAFMHYCFSRGCAEFAHLSRGEATDRLAAGRAILRECGLEGDGFVAPGWQQSREATVALASMGYRFTAFLCHVQPLVGDRRPLRTPALTFAAPNPLVDYGKRAVMRGWEAVARPAPLLRVALHPSDVHDARPLDHIVDRVRALLRHRRLVTYAEWLSEREGRMAA